MSKNFESVPQKLMVEIIRRRQVPQVIRRTTFKFRFFRKDEFSFECLWLITLTNRVGRKQWKKPIIAKSGKLHLAQSAWKRAQTGRSWLVCCLSLIDWKCRANFWTISVSNASLFYYSRLEAVISIVSIVPPTSAILMTQELIYGI